MHRVCQIMSLAIKPYGVRLYAEHQNYFQSNFTLGVDRMAKQVYNISYRYLKK